MFSLRGSELGEGNRRLLQQGGEREKICSHHSRCRPNGRCPVYPRVAHPGRNRDRYGKRGNERGRDLETSVLLATSKHHRPRRRLCHQHPWQQPLATTRHPLQAVWSQWLGSLPGIFLLLAGEEAREVVGDLFRPFGPQPLAR